MQRQALGTCSPHISLCIRDFFFPCFSPTGQRILSQTYGRHLTNTRHQLTTPGLSFLPAPDSIWMHADAIVGRLVDDVCCSYVCCHGSGTTVATSMYLRAADALQSVPIQCACLRAQRLYGMVLTQGAGSCNAKHTGKLCFTAVDQRRTRSPLCMHDSAVTIIVKGFRMYRKVGREGLKAGQMAFCMQLGSPSLLFPLV